MLHGFYLRCKLKLKLLNQTYKFIRYMYIMYSFYTNRNFELFTFNEIYFSEIFCFWNMSQLQNNASR